MRKYAGLLLVLLLVACGTTSKAYTFKVETGDKIEVSLNTTDGLGLSHGEDQFTVKSKDGSDVTTGIFLTEDMYMDYLDTLYSDDSAEIAKDAGDMIMWRYVSQAGEEYNRIIKVPDSNTYILLASVAPDTETERQVDAVYESLVFTKK